MLFVRATLEAALVSVPDVLCCWCRACRAVDGHPVSRRVRWRRCHGPGRALWRSANARLSLFVPLVHCFVAVGCGQNFDLTVDGANLWQAGLDSSAVAATYYYTTVYKVAL